jgi:hypothetical protein
MADLPADPFQYVGRIHRDDNGVVVSMEVFGPKNPDINLSEGDEFITFTTVMEL